MAGIERQAVRTALHHAMVQSEDRAIVGHLLDPEEGLLHVGWLVFRESTKPPYIRLRLLQKR